MKIYNANRLHGSENVAKSRKCVFAIGYLEEIMRTEGREVTSEDDNLRI